MNTATAPDRLDGLHRTGVPPVFLAYQQELMETCSAEALTVEEKSRRIGASWAAGAVAALTAGAKRTAGGMDVLYIGYNLDMAREFVDYVGFWSRHFNVAAAGVEETLFADGPDKSIRAYRVSFASGFEVMALSSKPRSLRGRQGFVMIDEAAFHDDLAELLKAAFALLIWGGKVLVMSTHDGADNPFNELIEEIRAKKRRGKVLRHTFGDAIRDGLYERVAMVMAARGMPVAPKEKWIADIREFYGEDATEELDVVPREGSGVWLSRATIKACMTPTARVIAKRFEDGFERRPDHVRRSEIEAWLEDELQPFIDLLDPDLASFLGGDFGRSGDLSVFMPGQLDRSGRRLVVPFTVELRNCPYRDQEFILNWLIDRLPRFGHAALDARGLGAALAEFAMQRYGELRVTQVLATAEWYRENMPVYKARFEDQTISLPLDEDTIGDHRLVRLDKGVAKIPENMRTRSTRGGQRHGDAAMAGVLLNFAAEQGAVAIEFKSLGERRAGYDAFGAPEIRDAGFGTVGGGTDFRGW